MCAYLLLNPNIGYLEDSVLELGSGVGLPGLLIGEIKRRHVSLQCGDLHMTDFDPRVLLSLQQSVKRQFQVGCSNYEEKSKKLPKYRIGVRKLDWDDFLVSVPSQEKIISDLLPCEIIIGAALCYSPHHTSVADTIK